MKFSGADVPSAPQHGQGPGHLFPISIGVGRERDSLFHVIPPWQIVTVSSVGEIVGEFEFADVPPHLVAR